MMGEEDEGKVKERRKKELGGVKQILRNYKDLANSQNQVLNTFLMKENSYKMPEAFNM